VIGSAVALNLLFHIPIWAGVLITAADVMFILLFGTRSVRLLELLVATLILTITCCFAYELGKADPSWLEVAKGFIPKPNILTNSQVIHRFKYAFVVLSWAKVVEFLVYRRCLQPLVSWEQR
jgi:manganese transport protein